MLLDCPLDAAYLGNVDTHTNDQDASSVPGFGPAAHSDYTVRAVAPRKTVAARRNAPKRGIRAGAAADWTECSARGIRILQVPALVKLPWLVHGFSTRPGGVSESAGHAEAANGKAEKVLNLGVTEWDSRRNVLENRRRFQSALGANDLKLISLKQIHSDVIHLFSAAPAEPCRGDASATDRPGLLLGVQTADCAPILLVDTKRCAVAAVHAGWRGTLQRIVIKAIGQMQMQFGTRPSDLLAAIGPAIGSCCYEVGTEVAIQFHSQFADAPQWFTEFRTGDEPNPVQWLNMMPPGHQPPPKNVLLDLPKANHAQLVDAGLGPKNIFVSNLCTACHCDLLFSYRKEGVMSGRLMAVVGVRRSAAKPGDRPARSR
jgi:YfiH family protein